MGCIAESCRYRRTNDQIIKRGLYTSLGNQRYQVIAFASAEPKAAACEAPGQKDFAVCTNLTASDKTCDRSPDYQAPKA